MKASLLIRCLFVAGLVRCSLIGQTVPKAVQVQTPVLGYFYDRAQQQFQSLVGIPGSGFPGPVIPVPAGENAVEISPAQDFALIILPDSGQLGWMPLDGSTSAVLPVAGAMSGITRLAISPSGKTALVYSAAAGKAQVFHKLHESPSLLHEFELAAIPVAVTAMAIDDAGDFALVAAQQDITSLFAVSTGTNPTVIYTAQSITSISFFRNSRQALAAAPIEKQVIWIQDAAGVPNPFLLAGARSGLAGPRDVASSEDGSRAFVLDGESAILSIPLSGAPLDRTTCACRPVEMRRLQGRDVFLLTPSVDAPPALVDAGGERMKTVFLPIASKRAALVPQEKKH